MVEWSVVAFCNPLGRSPIFLICEHASANIPPEYNGLMMAEEDLNSPAAWDPGALLVARRLSHGLDSTLAEATISRLIYDCNRPPESPEGARSQSERFQIPGNANLSAEEHALRVRTVHDPFHSAVERSLVDHTHRHGKNGILVTIHSFMPVFLGDQREVELGFLHGDDPEFANMAFELACSSGRYCCRMNEPYSASDGVMYSIDRHGSAQGLPSLMLEISNALIAAPEKAAEMGDYLAILLSKLLQATDRNNNPSKTNLETGS